MGADAVSCEPADTWARARDAWPRALLQARAGQGGPGPDAIAWPASLEQLQEVLRWAGPRGVPVIPVGGGTATTGASAPVRGGIALELSRMAGLPKLDLAGRTVAVDAGLRGARLEEHLNAQGASSGHFPDDIAGATVGGWMATRSAGRASARVGAIDDLVLSLEAVDGTGEVIRTALSSNGPDLKQLLLGSEGTLCVFTRATLRVVPKPTARWSRALRFPSLGKGLHALQRILRGGLRPTLARLHDPLSSLLAGKPGAVVQRVPQPLRALLGAGGDEALLFALRAPALLNTLLEALPGSSLLLLSFDGHGVRGEQDAAEEGAEALRACSSSGLEDLGPQTAEAYLRAPLRGLFLQGRIDAAGALVDTLDVAATWDRVRAVHAAVRSALRGRALVLARFLHPTLEGCATELTVLTPGGPAGGDEDELDEALARADGCWEAALSAAADAGATVSHHRGVGLSRQLFLPREHGEGLRTLRALKRAFDPHGILNPGKLLL